MKLDGDDFQASREEKCLAFLHLTEGALTGSELADWIRRHLKQV